MVPSSSPTARLAVTPQPEAQGWNAVNYPAEQQQNTPYQYIGGNTVEHGAQNLDNLFEQDKDEPVSYEEASNASNGEGSNKSNREAPNDDFPPSGWTDNDDSKRPTQGRQPVHYQYPPERRSSHASWSHHTPGHLAYYQEDSKANSDPDLDFGFQQLEQYMQSNQRQPPSRQHSLKPDPPYSGYSRNTRDTYSAYSGASDINRPRIASSNVDDPFSDVEDEEHEQSDMYGDGDGQHCLQQVQYDDEASGIPRATIPAYGKTAHQEATHSHVEEVKEEVFEDGGHEDYNDPRKDDSRRGPSPTDSQLLAEGFEFHNELPEELQIQRFNDKAFRKALREVRPELPRKQQWYAWQKVAQMLHVREEEHDEDNGYSPSHPQRDFPSASSLAHHGCQCGGDPGKCDCAPGQCTCSGCPRKHSVNQQGREEASNGRARHAQVEDEDDEQDDAPMDIGMTPITPMFPSIYDRHGIQKIPGLGQLSEEPEVESRPNRQDHHCKCGDDCRCPPGGCQCPELDEPIEPAHYHEHRLSSKPPSRLVKKAADSSFQLSSPLKSHQPSTPTSNATSSAPPQPCYIPQQGFSIVRSHPTPTSASSTSSTPIATTTPLPSHTPLSRPDTPRPLDIDVRQSVEPEMPLPNWHRESTPAYTDRSLSPSPTSVQSELDRIDGIGDIGMRDVTPTAVLSKSRAWPGSKRGSREGSVAPPSDGAGWRKGQERLPVGSMARTSSPTTVMSSPSRLHVMPTSRSARGGEEVSLSESLMHRANVGLKYASPQRSVPAPPPIPKSPSPSASTPGGLKPGKQRNGLGKKKSASAIGGVQGAKVEKPRVKSRSVTAKQQQPRKATGKAAAEKIAKAVGKDAKGEKQESGKVKEAVARIEERLVQKDGTPPRRSSRIRGKGVRVSYGEMV